MSNEFDYKKYLAEGKLHQPLNEKLSPERQNRLDSLRDELIAATDPERDYNGYEGREEEEILADIRLEFGDVIANQIEDGENEMHFPRDTGVPGYQSHDKLADKQQSFDKYRITKSGKMNKQDIKGRKTYLKRYHLSEDMRGMTPEMEEAVDLLIQMLTPVDTIESLLDNLTDDLSELPDEIDMDFFLNNIDAIEKEMYRQTRNVRFVKEENLNEDMSEFNPIRDIMERIQAILKDEHQPHVREYIKSVVRDIKLNPAKENGYYSEDREFYIEDFENFIADKM